MFGDKAVEGKGEWVVGFVAEGGEVREIGGGAETDPEGKTEAGGRVERIRCPVGFRGQEHGGEIDEKGLGSGEFEVGREGIDKGECFASGGGFGGGMGIEEEKMRAAGEGLGGAESDFNTERAGGLVDGDEMGFVAFAGGEECRGLVCGSAVAHQKGVESEVEEMECGVVHWALAWHRVF